MNQPSSPRSIGWGLTGWPPTGAGGVGSVGTNAGGKTEASDGPPDRPGRPATGTPWCALFISRLQISTGRPPPVAFLVGEESSLPSQTPVTRGAVEPMNQA